MVKVNGSQSDGRGRISSDGFFDELNLLCLGPQRIKMELDVLGQFFRGHDHHIFGRDEILETSDRLPEEGVLSHDVEHLLRPHLAAVRPETDARPACQNDGKDLFHILSFYHKPS